MCKYEYANKLLFTESYGNKSYFDYLTNQYKYANAFNYKPW